ncbi:MAG TPA: ornithine carbamoyltransferase [Chthoniobacteraceae bacterium]|jgi:ornithine carbamoyltransferase|nr:ornithine carbamoyltransferase [Chthoniobacteraceae bacterium]
MKHLLSIESLTGDEIAGIIDLGIRMKADRHRQADRPLAGQCWALMFSKASTRTRVSFEVGIRELGGEVMFLSSNDIQLGRGEPIQDTARVMGRMLGGAVIRTFAQSDVETFAEYSGIPTINALTDDEHPCQILADLQTIKEKLGGYAGRKICFIGDGACNVARSWIWAAARCGFELNIAAPRNYQPDAALLQAVHSPHVKVMEDMHAAARGADVLYTDVWVSMGKEEEAEFRIAQLAKYQINPELVAAAAPGALVMHCLPAYRGKEITAGVFEQHARTIFDEAENRLHAQKAVLRLLQEGRGA